MTTRSLPRLVISGIPGAGKTHFVKWLGGFGYAAAFNDNPPTTAVERAWAERDSEGLEYFFDALAGTPAPVALEYGLHPSRWAEVAELQARGMSAWWFDGDRTAAKFAWQAAWPGTPEALWDAQVRLIDQYADKLAWVFKNHEIRTVEKDAAHGYRHLTSEEICQTIFGNSQPPMG
jgi:hypothetical protein